MCLWCIRAIVVRFYLYFLHNVFLEKNGILVLYSCDAPLRESSISLSTQHFCYYEHLQHFLCLCLSLSTNKLLTLETLSTFWMPSTVTTFFFYIFCIWTKTNPTFSKNIFMYAVYWKVHNLFVICIIHTIILDYVNSFNGNMHCPLAFSIIIVFRCLWV